MSAAKIRDLVLPHSASNYLFREVLHYLAYRGDRTCSKVINLLNKETLLFIRKVLINFGLKVSSRASLAFLATHDGYMDKIVVFYNLAIIYNALRVNCGQRGLYNLFVDHFVVVKSR